MSPDQQLQREEPEPLAWLQERLVEWLQKPDWQLADLIAWLEGYGFPTSPVGEEPYLYLLNALPTGGDRFPIETELAHRAAVLLDRQPDVSPTGDPPERLLYNLLLLCAGLACPDELAESLFAMWTRRSLTGDWQGLDLRYALSAALAGNQLDSRLWNEWQAMLDDRPTSYLLGHAHDGFEGVLWMPESRERRGEPFLGAIGKALAAMAVKLEKKRDRRQEFRGLIARVTETFPDRPTWAEDLIRLADRYLWPGWAVECLPDLFLELDKTTEDTYVVMLWHLFVACLGAPGAHWSQRNSFCSGHVLEIQISASLFEWLSEIAPDIEDRRRSFPFPSERGLEGAFAHELAARELTEAHRGRADAADRISAARRKLLEIIKAGAIGADTLRIKHTLLHLADSLAGDPQRELELEARAQAVLGLWPLPPLVSQGLASGLPEWAAASMISAIHKANGASSV